MASPAAKTAEPEIEVPVVDLERIRETYAELKGMQVKLDPNPILYGPKRFNNRIAHVRAMLNRVDQVFLQVSEDLHLFKRIINAKRTLYDFEKRELMLSPSCRMGRSQGEREALADVQLRDQLEDLANLEGRAHDLETLMISIKSKRTDLKDAQGRMRDQMKLIEHDISMGARWGNNSAPSPVSSSISDIDSMLADVDAGLGIVESDDEEEVVVDDAGHDPSPHAEEPVLVFGEEDEEEAEEAVEEPVEEAPEEPDEEVSEEDETNDEDEDIEDLIPDEGSAGDLPGDDNSSDDVDSFLESIGSSDDDDEDGDDDDEEAVAGIDDLIASLADDD